MSKKVEYNNPLWILGITDPRPVGYYSGTTRDFAQESKSEELEQEFPIEVYQSGVEDSAYDDPQFKETNEKRWNQLIEAAGEDFTLQYPLWITLQSHIDLMWKWRGAQAIKKAQMTFGNALEHMRLYPNFCFNTSQTLLLEMIMRTNAEMFQEIKERVATGQFVMVGGSWAEYDARMPSGEALVRQRLYGQRFLQRHFNTIAEIEWHPDTFGFSWQLPQIIARSGGKYFFTTKFSNGIDTTFPFTQYHWVSPDGSKVLAYFTPGRMSTLRDWRKFKKARRLLNPGESFIFTYAVDHPEKLPIWSEELPPIVGTTEGKGDGGHGPTGGEFAILRDWKETGKNVAWVNANDFFHTLETVADRLPVFNDEGYYEYHRGTLTSHHLVKFMNRHWEWTTKGIESLASLVALLSDYRYPYERLTRIWKNICFLHMHDILPGSSIPEVYDDAYDIWALNRTWLSEIETEIVQIIMRKNNLEEGRTGLLLVNPIAQPRDQLVEIPWDDQNLAPTFVEDPTGTTAPIQYLDEDQIALNEWEKRGKRLLFPVSISSLGWKTVTLLDSTDNEMPTVDVVESEENFTLKNQYYTFTINKLTGTLDSLKILKSNSGLLSTPIETLTESSYILQGFHDFHPSEQAWNITPTYRTYPFDPEEVRFKGVEIIEKGPVRWTIQIINEWQAEDDPGITTFWQRISMNPFTEAIDLEILADWQTKDTTVKCFFIVAGDPQESIAEIPFGVIHRSLYPKADHDKPRWENHMHTFLTIPAQDGSFCFNIINEGKYGYDNMEGNKIGITTLRSPLYTDVPSNSWISEERNKRKRNGEGSPPEHADLGCHIIRMQLIPRAGDWISQRIEMAAHAFNSGMILHPISFEAVDASFLAENSDGIEIGGMKIAEEVNETDEDIGIIPSLETIQLNQVILRVNETYGTEHEGIIALSPALKVQDVKLADLLEQPNETEVIFTKDEEGNIIKLKSNWLPHEIKTFILIR